MGQGPRMSSFQQRLLWGETPKLRLSVKKEPDSSTVQAWKVGTRNKLSKLEEEKKSSGIWMKGGEGEAEEAEVRSREAL